MSQLSPQPELPRWLGKTRENYSVWERANRWVLLSALAYGADKVHLVVLWDGQDGEGRGGTAHMVRSARDAGAEVWHIDTRQLFH